MKKIIIAAFAVLALFAGSAKAESEYSVKKGDNLTKIARNYSGIKATDIFEANRDQIRNINLIYPGQKLRIPDPGTQPWNWNHLLANPYQRTLEQGLSELGFYDPGMEYALALASRAGNYDNVYIKKGTMVPATIFGRGIVKKNVRINWEGWAKVYAATTQTDNVIRTCKLLYPDCGNPTPWYCEESAKAVPEAPPETPVPAPPEPIQTPPGVEEEEPPSALPPEEAEEPEEEKFPPFVEEEEEIACPAEHQPMAGAGVWSSGVAKGNFYFGEHMTYFKRNCGSEYSYGAGLYIIGEDGDSRLSAYEWWGKGYGPQIGVKKYSLRRDKNGKYLAHQMELKIRFIREYVAGGNPASGYQMDQKGWKAGVYLEKVDEISDRWKRIITAEAWWNFDRHMNTTWQGDTPANRSQAMLAAYGQYKINETWQTRIGGGFFYQAWDREAGIHLRAEARYNEWLMFGPYANIFLWKTAVYDGIPLWDLQTIGDFVRVEAFELIRRWDRQIRMERVKQLDDEKYGFIEVSQNIDTAHLPATIGSQAEAGRKTNQ